MKVAIERLETETSFGVEIVHGLTPAALSRWIERQSNSAIVLAFGAGYS
ncbi:hypothetical protein [Cupriavidus basilensis]|nr:hypothetical protein [Cupriavidus basilensis]